MSRFLAAYQSYVSKATDAPYEFGHAGGLMCLSTIALGRRRLDRGTGIHPNLFTMLVAGSSKDRKSTSINLAIDVIKQVEDGRVAPNDFTAEGLISHMRRKNPTGKGIQNKIVVPMEEFGTYLAAARGYAASMSALLCHLYDGQDYVQQRSGKKPRVVLNPRVSLFSAVAYGMMEKFADPKDWITGFYARFLFVTPGPVRPQRNLSVPVAPKQDYSIACAALADLRKELKASVGAMGVTQQAEFDHAQFSATMQANIGDDDPVMAAQRERYLNIVWKLALLYQIDENPAHPIGPAAMRNAINFVWLAWQSFMTVYNATAGSEFSRVLRRVQQKIVGSGAVGVSKRDLLKAFHLTSEKLVPILDILTKLGEIEVRMVPQANGSGRPREICFERV